MSTEQSAGAIIFRKQGGQTYYLLLRYKSSRPGKSRGGHWDFTKGHIEKGETETETVVREVREETGLSDIRIISGFREVIKYFFHAENRNVFKTVVFYLAETKTKEIRISGEHEGFIWLPYKEALAQVTFKNAKKILERANDYIVSE